MRKLITLVMVGTGLVLAGCNTIEGAGRDIQSVGDKVSDAAN